MLPACPCVPIGAQAQHEESHGRQQSPKGASVQSNLDEHGSSDVLVGTCGILLKAFVHG